MDKIQKDHQDARDSINQSVEGICKEENTLNRCFAVFTNKATFPFVYL